MRFRKGLARHYISKPGLGIELYSWGVDPKKVAYYWANGAAFEGSQL